MGQLLYSLFLFLHHHFHLLDCSLQFLQWWPKRKIFPPWISLWRFQNMKDSFLFFQVVIFRPTRQAVCMNPVSSIPKAASGERLVLSGDIPQRRTSGQQQQHLVQAPPLLQPPLTASNAHPVFLPFTTEFSKSWIPPTRSQMPLKLA